MHNSAGRVPTFSEPRGNAKWQAGIYGRHGRFTEGALRPHIQQLTELYGYREANTRLRELDARLTLGGDLVLSWDDCRIRDWCESWASACRRMVERCGDDVYKAVQAARRVLARYSLELPEPRQWGLTFADTYAPTLARICCPRWWRRQVRKLQRRALDDTARDIRIVSRFEQIYCADETVHRYKVQRQRNRGLLDSLQAVNQYGESFTLAELAEKSISNPANRRAELMVRLRGFEEVAEARGHVAEFYTLTAPSKYHRHKGREANPNWNGSSPREVQLYFRRLWSRVRAAWEKAGIRPYGFRIVEPHHDGCPHWHLLLWMPRKEAREVRRTLRRYALAEDGREPGAARHRFTVERIDPAKGSAVHYVAKYVAKNIDGHAVGEGKTRTQSGLVEHGAPAESAAERILAWASTHGIRQFQQVGGPPVGVWRELRRIEGEEAGTLGELVAAADAADWAAYVELMGGPQGRRGDAPVSVARWLEYHPETGEALGPWRTRYGDESPGRVFGLVCRGVYHLTRPYRWAIEWARSSIGEALAAYEEYRSELGPLESLGDPVASWRARVDSGPGGLFFEPGA